MITSEGKTWIKRALTGNGIALGDSIGVGIGNAAEALSDTALQYEIDRFSIELITYDHATDQIVFKGTMRSEMAATIYEVGIWTQPANFVANGYGSMALTTFDEDAEAWSNATWSATGARIGTNGLSHTPAASGTVTSSLLGLTLNLGGYSSADKFLVAFNSGNANTSSVIVRLKTDDANYFQFTSSNPASGYTIASFTKGSAAITGNPSWENITKIDVVTSAKAGGAAAVTLDGIRVEDVDSINPEYVMLAREVLVTPIVKVAGETRDFEYAISITL